MMSTARFRPFKAMVSGAAVVFAFGLAGGIPALAQSSGAAHLYPWNDPACPCQSVLHVGTPAQAGLIPQALGKISGTASRALARRVAPGMVVLVARRGTIAYWKAYGYADLYKNAHFDFVAHPAAMQKNEIFDLASVSKLFTAVAVMQLWDEGKFKLDDPVAKYLPAFAANGKKHVTIRELLTHTSGFQPDPPTPLYKIPGSRKDRLKYVMGLPLKYPPRTHYIYSDINFIVLGALIERLSGEREDVFVHKHITEPLHMTDTMYNPPATLKPRIAASEYQPWTHRGMLHGQVDDENAWALGGVAGHAGVFSDARDLATFGQMILNDGTYNGARILSKRAVKLLLTNWDKKFPGNFTGLGWSIERGWFMGALSGPHTAGHEGFTGTSLLVNPNNDIVTVILTNRVHPTRNGPSDTVPLRRINTDIANAIPVAIPGDGKAWFSGYGDHLNRPLTAKVAAPARTLSFKTWYRTQPEKDYGIIEASSDGTHWTVLDRLTGSSNGWKTRKLALPKGTRYVRFNYQTDASVNGRGWYVHDVRVDGHKVDGYEKSDWVKRDY